MHPFLCSIPLLFAGVVVLGSNGLGKTHRITVEAANVPRAAHVVEFKVPADAKELGGVQDPAGRTLPLQISPDHTARFIVPTQAAGKALSFTLVPGGGAERGVEVIRHPSHLQLQVAGKPAFAYRTDKDTLPRPDIKPEFKRAGYLHPIHTPSGTVVSDDYPVQHVHHHGIWSPWTMTRFQGRTPDFWNMGKKTGTVEAVAVDWTWNGPVHGGFVARHQFVDLSAKDPVVVLHETWEVTTYKVEVAPGGTPVQVFDLLLTQVCATNDPLVLPKYHYGGLGFRGRGEWYGKDKANFLTSDGETDRVKANARPMRWVYVSGAVESGTAGLAVLGHPDNFRAPQPVRVHPNEPYVSFTPSEGGEFTIEPGKPYVARFRFVAADGVANRDKLDALWNGYAVPTVARIETLP